MVKNIIVLVAVLALLFFLYRSCTKGYDSYAYFVHVTDEAVYANILSENNTRITDHGRKLKADIILMDRDIDKGNGPNKGVIRWYDCKGIDCDEGWQHSFLPEK